MEWQAIRADATPMPEEEFAHVRALTENRRIENVTMGIIRVNEDVEWFNVTAIPLGDDGVVVTYHKSGEQESALKSGKARQRKK